MRRNTETNIVLYMHKNFVSVWKVGNFDPIYLSWNVRSVFSTPPRWKFAIDCLLSLLLNRCPAFLVPNTLNGNAGWPAEYISWINTHGTAQTRAEVMQMWEQSTENDRQDGLRLTTMPKASESCKRTVVISGHWHLANCWDWKCITQRTLFEIHKTTSRD